MTSQKLGRVFRSVYLRHFSLEGPIIELEGGYGESIVRGLYNGWQDVSVGHDG